MRPIHVCVGVVAASLLFVGSGETGSESLSFEERVAAQRAIERTYYAHLNGSTRSFEEAVPRTLLEEKVRTYLKLSVAMERLWGERVTGELLRAELDRIAVSTRMPDRLLELYAALDYDSLLIEECLVRPIVVDRLARQAFASDPVLHADALRQAEELHDLIAAGSIDPCAEHPLRWLPAEAPACAGPEGVPVSPTGVGEVEERSDAFTIRVDFGSSEENASAAFYVIPKANWETWWEAIETDLDESDAVAMGSRLDPIPMPFTHSADALRPDLGAGAHCKELDQWLPTSRSGAPSPRSYHSAAWTGTQMVIWGGNVKTGGRYDPVTDSWSPMTTKGAPQARWEPTAVWTGDEVIVWGGYQTWPLGLASGGRYDPIADRWVRVSIGRFSPSPRLLHSAVWTGGEMIVWGGRQDMDYQLSGSRYDPRSNRWSAMSLEGVPEPRQQHTAIWTGDRMIVWGGACYQCVPEDTSIFYNSGGLYDPATDSWAPTSTIDAPKERTGHTAVWTGVEMLIWGGSGPYLWGGTAHYDPVTDAWLQTGVLVDEPDPRYYALSVWTGREMIVWGGPVTNTGGRYDPATRTWSPTSLVEAPSPRWGPTMIFDGQQAIVWGGQDSTLGFFLDDGARYCAVFPPGP